MVEQESSGGVPGATGGGWGAKKGEGGGRVIEPYKPPTVTSGGTYTDAQGRPITREQAQQQGTIDKPGEFQQKAQSIGLSPMDVLRQAAQQGKTPEQALEQSRQLALPAFQQRIIARDPNISISQEIRQSRDIHGFLAASQRGSVNPDTGRYEQGISFAPRQEQRAVQLASKLGSVPEYYTYRRTYEPQRPEYKSPISNRIPSPFPSSQERWEEYVFSQPRMTNIDKIRGEGEFGRLPRHEKAGLLITAGFNRPEIAASYFESKITGKPTGYQEQIYKYAMKDSKTVTAFGKKYAVPKPEVLKDTGVGIASIVAVGAAFKGLTYLGAPVVKSVLGKGGKALEYAESRLGLAATRTTGTGSKTALQTSETLAELSKSSVMWGARHPEAVIGAGVASVFVADVAQSKTKGEAVEKVGRAVVTLPLMGEGYKGTERVGYAMPTASQFKGFVASKASPIVARYEPGITARLNRLPDSFKRNIEMVRSKAIKEPSGYDLMTPTAQQIYRGLPTQQAKIMMETTQKALSLIADVPRPAIKKMYQPKVSFGITREFGVKGLEAEKVLRANPSDILIGSLSTAKFIPGFRQARTPTPEGVKLSTGIGDIELAARTPEPYIKAGLPKEAIHGLTTGTYPFGTPGQPILTKFGGKEMSVIGARVQTPIKVKGIQYMSPVEQAYRKAEGSYKYLSRKTNVIKDIEAREKEYNAMREGYSIRRGKDVQDVPEIIEALAKAHPDINKRTEALELMRKFREAEATKLYSGLPVEKYAYEYVKEYPGMVKTPPILIGYGKGGYAEMQKKVSSYYPKSTQKETYPGSTKRNVIVGSFYPSMNKPSFRASISEYPTTKPSKTLYPTLTHGKYSEPVYERFLYPTTRTFTTIPPGIRPPRKPPIEPPVGLPDFKSTKGIKKKRKTKTKTRRYLTILGGKTYKYNVNVLSGMSQSKALKAMKKELGWEHKYLLPRPAKQAANALSEFIGTKKRKTRKKTKRSNK